MPGKSHYIAWVRGARLPQLLTGIDDLGKDFTMSVTLFVEVLKVIAMDLAAALPPLREIYNFKVSSRSVYSNTQTFLDFFGSNRFIFFQFKH